MALSSERDSADGEFQKNRWTCTFHTAAPEELCGHTSSSVEMVVDVNDDYVK